MKAHLGIHSKYELGAGTRSFEDIIQKAKFLDVFCIGICDKNTLAGTFAFQTACKKANIDFCLGEQVIVKRKEDTYELKLYVKNKTGWQNLLRINKAIKVDNNGFIDEKELLERGRGLICVITPDAIQHINKAYYYKISKSFDSTYFQFDPVEYKSNERDKQHILNLQKYLSELYDVCPPILIQDSYYLDKEDAVIKQRLANITGKEVGYQSEDLYIKSIDDVFSQLARLFNENDETIYEIIESALEATEIVSKACKFEIPTGKLHLPIYDMTPEEQEKYSSNEDFFMSLIFEGLGRIEKADDEEYLNRIQEEVDVIKRGGFIDYFLILVDVYRFADENNVYRNLARGSIGGSLVAYCVGLIKLDPIKYDLLFVRFLNDARIMKTIKKEFMVLDTEEGEVTLEPNKEIKVLRNSQEISILAKELEENDCLI